MPARGNGSIETRECPGYCAPISRLLPPYGQTEGRKWLATLALFGLFPRAVVGLRRDGSRLVDAVKAHHHCSTAARMHAPNKIPVNDFGNP